MFIYLIRGKGLFLFLAFLLFGCNSDSNKDSDRECNLSGMEPCECDDGREGVKACDSAGEIVCMCKEMVTPETDQPDTETDTETDTNWPDSGKPPSDTDTQEDKDAGPPPKEVCAEQSTEARPGIGKAVDIIFVIDNSGSMNAEIAAVENNINSNFAAIIGGSGVDYRVIMLSIAADSGSYTAPVCIGPPLGGAPCIGATQPTNGDRFFHYDVGVYSNDAWCIMLSTFTEPDVHGFAPLGWSEWLRADANKAFVIITDDRARCSFYDPSIQETRRFGYEDPPDYPDLDPARDAVNFDKALLQLSAEHFGTSTERRYLWHSIVGMAAKADDPTIPLYYDDPIEDDVCTAENGEHGVAPGEAYQYLSKATGGLRYSVCEGEGFDTVFKALAFGVIAASKAECTFEIPAAPEGQVIDLDTVIVEYTGNQGTTQQFGQVQGLAACNASSFYIANDKIELCPLACSTVESDDHAKVNVLFSCDPDAPPPPDAGDPGVQ